MSARVAESETTSHPTLRGEHATLAVVTPDLAPFPELRSCMARFGGRVRHFADPAEAMVRIEDFDAAIVAPPEFGVAGGVSSAWQDLVRRLESGQVATLVVGAATTAQWPSTVCVASSVSAEEMSGRIDTALRFRSILRENEREMARLRRLGLQLNRHFEELDQEMRLAGRLQRDFLPRELPRAGAVQFHALYRPATWVSGDIYDVLRLDDVHVAFYVADAVGHGVAAGLLTMYIKRSIHGRESREGNVRVLSPGETLSTLNNALAGQGLPNCQFATACYGVVNSRTLRVSLARAGHPYPIHVRGDGRIEEVSTGGGLLGVFAGEEFPVCEIGLSGGDKLILYSDGLEEFFISERDPVTKQATFGREFRGMAAESAEEVIARIRHRLDTDEGSINPADDVTLMILETGREIAPSGATN